MISSTQTHHPLPGGANTLPPKQRIEEACVLLRSSGLRVTQPRIAIIQALISHDSPISIENIHEDLRSGSCDLVTVYRCLAAFVEIGLVRRSFFHNGTSLYEMSDSGQLSYHIVLKDTGEIRALDAEMSRELADAIAKVESILLEQGYSQVSHITEFFAKSQEGVSRSGLVKAAVLAES